MNYLSHLFLAEQSSEFLTGALMGDFLRGVDRSQLPPNVENGVVHHLVIDSFTDSHELIKQTKKLFTPPRRRFAGIILDVTFDHFLIKQWVNFSEIGFDQFIENTHRSLKASKNIMPSRMEHVVNLLIKHDVLRSYRRIESVGVALDRIADRLSKRTPLYDSLEEIISLESEIEKCFTVFFEELEQKFGNGRMGNFQ